MERKIYRYGEEPEDACKLRTGDIIEIECDWAENEKDVIDLPMGIFALVDSVDYINGQYCRHIILNIVENTEEEQLAGLLREIGKTSDVEIKKVLKKLLDMHFLHDRQINFCFKYTHMAV